MSHGGVTQRMCVVLAVANVSPRTRNNYHDEMKYDDTKKTQPKLLKRAWQEFCITIAYTHHMGHINVH